MTPPVIKTKEISTIYAHLVEHIVGTSFENSTERFFTLVDHSIAETFSSYTRYYFPDDISIDEAQHQLFKGIDKIDYKREKIAINTELKETRDYYLPGLAYRISQKLYSTQYKGDYDRIPSFRNTESYHVKWYNRDNIIISNNDDAILYIGSNLKANKSIGKDKIEKIAIKQGKNNIINICFSHSSSANHRKAFFLYQLIEAYIKYNERYIHGEYYYNKPEYFKTWKHRVISYNKDQLEGLNKDFFETFKKNYIVTMDSRIDKYRKIIDRIHGILPLSDIAHQAMIKKINISEILHLLHKKST